MINYQFFKEKLLGYALSGSTLFSAKLTTSSSRLTIESLDCDLLQTDTSKRTVAVAFPSVKTLVRQLELALVKSKDINATFMYEAEPLLPYPIEKCIIEKVRIGHTNDSSRLQLFVATKEDLLAYLEMLKERHIDPEVLCPKALALCHFAKYFLPKDDIHTLINIDEEETTCVSVQNGLPLFCRSHPEGLNKLRLAEEETHLPELHQFLREIARILLSLQNGSDLQNGPLLFTGPVVDNPELVQLLTAFFNRQCVEELSIPSHIHLAKPYSWQNLCHFATPIGAALSSQLLKKEMSSVNLRKEDLMFADKWRHWKKELVTYFSLMMVITGAIFAIGQMSLEKGRIELVEKYAQLLAEMETPSEIVEQEYTKAFNNEFFDIVDLPSSEIQDRLYFLENRLNHSSEEMALHPDVPRISDLLHWLAKHPKVVGDESGSLKLENIAYVMTKRPEKGKIRERYTVRIDLEFSSPNPTMAREFHDALLTPNAFIDPKNELKWSVQKGRYRITFFLKDKTQYPQSLVQGDLHAIH